MYGSFLQSRMNQAGVSCGDCHDPHSPELITRQDPNVCARSATLPTRFSVVRARCHHRREGSKGAECVDCHMPSRNYMVIDEPRDHCFRVPRPDRTVSLGTPNACNGCHVDNDSVWATAAINEWRGSGLAERPICARDRCCATWLCECRACRCYWQC